MVELHEIIKKKESLRNLKEILNKYKLTKEQIMKLQSEIEAQKKERGIINIKSLTEKREKLEAEYKKIIQQVEAENLASSDCKNFKEIKKYLENLSNTKLLKEKCILFCKRNIELHYAKTNLSKENIKCVICIKKELEEFFTAISNKAFYSDVLNCYKTTIKQIMNNYVPADVEMCENKESIFICIDSEDKNVFGSSYEFTDLNKIAFDEFLRNFPAVSISIGEILKNNLTERIVEEKFSPERILKNNKLFENTRYFSKNINEYVVDCIMKCVLKLTREKINEDDVFLLPDEGKYVSKSFIKLTKCITLLKKTETKRMQKAVELIQKSVLRYFSTPYDELELLFILYADISRFVEDFYEFSTEKLSHIKLDLKEKLLTKSSDFQINLNNETIQNKAILSKTHYEFEQNCKKYVKLDQKTGFNSAFFSLFYSNFINFVIKARKYSKEEKNELYDISRYMLELSYNQTPSNIASYDEMLSLSNVLKSDIYELFELFNMGNIHLNKYDLKMAIKVLFNDSPQRDLLLEKIK
ncbi:hypothetical protein NUSPORA_01538 [Nucleospora cyclopteri]